jgi:ankyrin repeat protein
LAKFRLQKMLRVIVPIPDFVWWLRKPLGFLLLAMMVRKLYQASTAVTCLMKRRKALIIAARDGTLSNVKLLLSGTPSSDHAFLLQPEEAWQGVTAVYAAALRGHTVCCKELLLAGAEPDQPNAMGDVPLAIAAQEGHAAIISLLLRSNVAVDRQAPGSGATALQLACMQGHTACVRVLLAGGAATDTANADGNTALFLCCEHGHVECARRIVAKLGLGVRQLLSLADNNGFTPVQLARVAMEGDGAACIELLSAAAATGTHA